MSEIENVSKKILDDANKQKDVLIQSANKKAEEVLKEADDKKSKLLSDAKKDSSEKYDQVYDMELSKSKAELDQKVLLKKLDLVEAVLEKAKNRLRELGPKEYAAYVKSVLNNLDISEGTYLLGKNEKVLEEEAIKPLLEEMNIKKSKEDPDFDEGLKIFSGNAQYSISFYHAIEAIKDELKIEIASYIFDEEK